MSSKSQTFLLILAVRLTAITESFFHTLKTELVYHELYETKAQANQSIFEYIEVYYNRQRMHSSNQNLSPVEFENMMLQTETAA
jgi:transposase InsO family protein